MFKQIGSIGATLLGTTLLLAGNAQASTEIVAQTVSPASPNPNTSEQRPISVTKRLLIYQLMEISGGREMHEQMNQTLLTYVQQQIQPLAEQTVGSMDNLSPAEEQAIIAGFNEGSTFMTQLLEAVFAEITYDEALEQIYYPLYDQYFTEEDLRNLIAFYRTPIGEKLVAVSPELVQKSLQLSSELYMPKIMEFVQQSVEQRVNQMQDSPGDN